MPIYGKFNLNTCFKLYIDTLTGYSTGYLSVVVKLLHIFNTTNSMQQTIHTELPYNKLMPYSPKKTHVEKPVGKNNMPNSAINQKKHFKAGTQTRGSPSMHTTSMMGPKYKLLYFAGYKRHPFILQLAPFVGMFYTC